MNKANYYLGVFLIIFSFSAWADKGNFFFENVSNNPFDINEIKRNIYSDLDLDLDTKQINYSVKKIEYLFLDLIIFKLWLIILFFCELKKIYNKDHILKIFN